MVKTYHVLRLIEQGINECLGDEYIIENIKIDKNILMIDFVNLLTNKINTYKIKVELC